MLGHGHEWATNTSARPVSIRLSKDYFPGHAGCYHLLGFTLYVLNELEDALSILEIGSMVDPNYEPIRGKAPFSLS